MDNAAPSSQPNEHGRPYDHMFDNPPGLAPARLSAAEAADAALQMLGRRAIVTVGVLAITYHFLIAPPLGLPRVDVGELGVLAALVCGAIAGKLGERFLGQR